MNPSPAAIAAIRARVADWTPTDAAIATSLNAPAIANPAPQATVPKPFTVQDVFGKVTTSIAKINAIPYLPDIRDKVQDNDVAGCNLYANLLLAGGNLTQAEHDEILSLVNATQPDPGWTARIGWALATLGRPVDASDIAASRPGA